SSTKFDGAKVSTRKRRRQRLVGFAPTRPFYLLDFSRLKVYTVSPLQGDSHGQRYSLVIRRRSSLDFSILVSSCWSPSGILRYPRLTVILLLALIMFTRLDGHAVWIQP